jgi:hypothetical protein
MKGTNASNMMGIIRSSEFKGNNAFFRVRVVNWLVWVWISSARFCGEE